MSRSMKFRLLGLVGVLAAMVLLVAGGARRMFSQTGQTQTLPGILQDAQKLVEDGRAIFRFDTFGSEDFWGGQLRLHQSIAGTQGGGIAEGLSPRRALSVGLKVDADALPPDIVQALANGAINLDDAAVTVELLRLNAVVGLTGFFESPPSSGRLQSLGTQCALCHSTVNNSLAPGIGQRLDGWANRDLNIGAIIALAPTLKAFEDVLGVPEQKIRDILNSWGPGKFDAELILDGKAFRDDGKPAATLIPPAFGLLGVNLSTWTGWGNMTHWNALVSNLEMHGKGTFYDPRLNNISKFPVATRAGLWNIASSPDRITPQLAALHFYQLALQAPAPPSDSYNAEAAGRGQTLFAGKARCATCHVPPLFTEPGWNMHTADEIGIDDFQAKRSPDERYRTAPLRGLWTHTTGGFYHDGRFPTLRDVIEHYNSFIKLGLTDSEKTDLEEYLKSL